MFLFFGDTGYDAGGGAIRKGLFWLVWKGVARWIEPHAVSSALSATIDMPFLLVLRSHPKISPLLKLVLYSTSSSGVQTEYLNKMATKNKANEVKCELLEKTDRRADSGRSWSEERSQRTRVCSTETVQDVSRCDSRFWPWLLRKPAPQWLS